MDEKKKYRTEIVPYSLPQNNDKTCEIGIEKMSITYVQENDTNNRDEYNPDQYITIETESNIPSREDALNKEAYYYVIKTDRWAIENGDELSILIKDFEDRLYHNIEELKKNG